MHPIFKDLFYIVPKKYRGRWSTQEGAYVFDNGSMIHISGVSLGHVDDLRGTVTDLAVIDEAGFVDDLGYLIDSVLMPQLLTVKDSRLIMASSSPSSPAHEFCEYILKAKHEGNYHSYDITQGGYDEDVVAEFCKEAGGKDSTTWRREYLNEIIVDADSSIVPEAAKHLRVGIVKTEFRQIYHNYVSMDIGVKDLTVVLFGYYDFKRAKLCIERELVMNGPSMTTDNLSKRIALIEREAFGTVEPYMRVSDNNNLLLLNDLNKLHDCYFFPTSKDTLDAMVNEMRIFISNDRLEIDASCTILIDSLKFGFWNEARNNWGKSATLGHFDAVAALMYMIRNLDQTTNPFDGLDQVKPEPRRGTIMRDLIEDGTVDELDQELVDFSEY